MFLAFLIAFFGFSLAPLFAHKGPALGGLGGQADRLGLGISELGGGNTGSARLDVTAATFWNPAVLPFFSRLQISLGEDLRFLNRNGAYASIEGRIAPNLAAGLVIHNRGDFDVPVYDANEVKLGTARPQEIHVLLGVGVKTSRFNSLGLSVGGYSRSMDLGGEGDAQNTGILNLGWYRQWPKQIQTALTIRNLGFNKKMSASYTSQSSSGLDGFSGTQSDYFPKTFVAAFTWPLMLSKKELILRLEALDYLLVEEVWDNDGDHHAQGFRLGVDYSFLPELIFRGGYDQGNFSLGSSYVISIGKKKWIVDYALLFERGWVFVNPFALGLRAAF